MIAGSGIEGSGEFAHCAQVFVRLSVPHGSRARVALHHVANGEDCVRSNDVQIFHRSQEVWNAPRASGRAVGKNGDALHARASTVFDYLAIGGTSAVIRLEVRRGACRGGGHGEDDESGGRKHAWIVYANAMRRTVRWLEIGLVCSSSRGAVYAFAVYDFAVYAFAVLVPAPGKGIDGPRMMDSHAAAS